MTASPDPAVEIVTDPLDKIRALKNEDRMGIYLMGGAALAGTPLPEIDELVIKVYPVVIGAGVPLFTTGFSPTTFAHTGARTLDSGTSLVLPVRLSSAAYWAGPVGVAVATALFVLPLLREAITNILRHATVEQCTIQLSMTDDVLRLRITNDGVASPDATSTGGHREPPRTRPGPRRAPHRRLRRRRPVQAGRGDPRHTMTRQWPPVARSELRSRSTRKR
jgi:hypothetical protein